jgi:hypothetical protein
MDLNGVYRRLVKMTLEELQLMERQMNQLDQEIITKDYDKMRDLLQVPFWGWGDRGVASLESMDEVIKFYRSTREDIDTRGYKTSRVDLSDARITVLSPTRVLFQRSLSPL